MNTFFSEGSTEIRNEKKEEFCYLFREFIGDFVEKYITIAIGQCRNDWEFVTVLIEKWNQFKRFVHFYCFLLQTVDNHYEMSYKTYKNQAKTNKIDSPDSIFPLSVIAIHFF